MSTIPVGRYKLKSYVFFGRVDDGTWFEAGAKSFVLKNPRLYPIAEKLVSLLDAGHPVEAIMTQAPEPVRPVFAALLASLLDNDMLQPLARGHASPPLGRRGAGDELLAMLEDRIGGNALEAAVTRWSTARVALVGAGYALKAAAGAIATAGCRELTLCFNPGTGVTPSEITEFAADRCAAGTQLRQAADPAAVVDHDLVIVASDLGDVALAEMLAATGRAVVAGVFAGHACVVPTTGSADLADFLYWHPAAEPAAASHGPTSLGILGCVAAQAGLDAFFGFEAERWRGRITVVGSDLEVRSHPLVPRPVAGRPVDNFVHALRHQLPDERALETFEIVKLALDPWFDPLFGPFRVSDDSDLRQMPLMQYPIDVRRPGHADVRVVGWGLDLGEAGLRAIDAAVAHLAAPLVPAGAVTAVGLAPGDWERRAGAAASVAGSTFAAGRRAAWLPLDAVDDGRVRILRRLLRYHTTALARARLHWSTAAGGIALDLCLGDIVAVTVVGDDLVELLVEALGRACSDFQLGGSFWQAQAAAVDAVQTGSCSEDWREAFIGDARPTEVDYYALTGLGLPPVIACGYAVARGGALG